MFRDTPLVSDQVDYSKIKQDYPELQIFDDEFRIMAQNMGSYPEDVIEKALKL